MFGGGGGGGGKNLCNERNLGWLYSDNSYIIVNHNLLEYPMFQRNTHGDATAIPLAHSENESHQGGEEINRKMATSPHLESTSGQDSVSCLEITCCTHIRSNSCTYLS